MLSKSNPTIKKILLIIAAVILAGLLVVAGYLGYKRWMVKKPVETTQTAQANQAPSEPEAPKVVKRPGSYITYDPTQFSLASDGKVVLFFNAKWSQTSKQVDKDLKAAKLPDNFTVMNVDYDKNAALRKKYGVPFEDTFVQVDAAGVIINRWSGSEDVTEIIALTK